MLVLVTVDVLSEHAPDLLRQGAVPVAGEPLELGANRGLHRGAYDDYWLDDL